MNLLQKSEFTISEEGWTKKSSPKIQHRVLMSSVLHVKEISEYMYIDDTLQGHW